jgi:hypothetical protein
MVREAVARKLGDHLRIAAVQRAGDAPAPSRVCGALSVCAQGLSASARTWSRVARQATRTRRCWMRTAAP